MAQIDSPANVGSNDGLGLVQDRAAFDRLVLQLTGRDMDYHNRNGTTGLDTAWLCYRAGVAAERERYARTVVKLLAAKAMRDAQPALNVGAELANVAFNLAQKAGHALTSDDVAMLDGLRRKWDEARNGPNVGAKLETNVAREDLTGARQCRLAPLALNLSDGLGLWLRSEEDMDYCCDAFKEEAKNLQAPVGGGMLYPHEMRPLAQFEPDEDGETWNVNGCCGGGCYVVTAMRFCPFCGTKLAHPGLHVEQA